MRIAFCFSFSYCSCCFVLFRLRVLNCMCSYTFNMKTQFFHIHFALWRAGINCMRLPFFLFACSWMNRFLKHFVLFLFVFLIHLLPFFFLFWLLFRSHGVSWLFWFSLLICDCDFWILICKTHKFPQTLKLGKNRSSSNNGDVYTHQINQNQTVKCGIFFCFDPNEIQTKLCCVCICNLSSILHCVYVNIFFSLAYFSLCRSLSLILEWSSGDLFHSMLLCLHVFIYV